MIKKLEGMLETVEYEANSQFAIHHNFEVENYPKHWHSATEIIMPMQNKYEVIVNGITFLLEEFDIILIPSGDIHEIKAPSSLGQRIFLQFDLSLLKEVKGIADSSYVFIKPWHITSKGFPELHKKLKTSLMEMLDEYLYKHLYFEANITARIIGIVIDMARNYHNGNDIKYTENQNKRKDHIDKFHACIEYINKHYKENLTLDLVSHTIGFSKYHFARWFKQFANISFYDYMTHVRIQAVENLLLNSEIPITEIALESGFQSITTFNRIFKEYKKCTPSEYRRYHLLNNKCNSEKLYEYEDSNGIKEPTVISSAAPPAIFSIQPEQIGREAIFNPFIYADLPGLDIIRVGGVYYATSTSMHFMPGYPIMQSYDLINWEIVNYVYDILDDSDSFTFRNNKNAYGKSFGANSLRYYNGTFYIAFAEDITEKTFIFQTEDIENGPWRRYTFDGIYHGISLLFDDDGKVFMVYYDEEIKVVELASDATEILKGGINKVIIHKPDIWGNGGLNSEVSHIYKIHIYKINGKYYIFLIVQSPTGFGTRIALCYRSDNIDGQYEGVTVFDDNLPENVDTAHGGIIDTPDGDWYAVLYQSHGPAGNTPVLAPVYWEADWPKFHINYNGSAETAIPVLGIKVTNIVASDEFYQSDVCKNYSAANDSFYRYCNKVSDSEIIHCAGNKDDELIINGRFENGIKSWSFTNIATVSACYDKTITNSCVLYVSKRFTTSSGPMQVITGKVIPWRVYKVHAMVKYVTGPDTKYFNACIRNGARWEGIQIMGSGIITKGEWGSIEGTYTLPADADLSETIIFIETPWEYNPKKDVDLMDFYVGSVSVIAMPLSKANKTVDGENDYNGSNLAFQWQWNHNPDNNNWSLTANPGYLRLIIGSISYGLEDARNTLTQCAFGPKCSGTIAIDVSNMKDGDVAGLAAFHEYYGYVGVKMVNNTKSIVMVNAGSGQAQEIESIPLKKTTVYLKVDFDFSTAISKAYFFYSLNEVNWIPIGNSLQMDSILSHFAGHRFALFNYATQITGGYVDFDYFRLSDKLTENNDTLVILNAAIGDVKEVVGVQNTQFELPIMMEALPSGQYRGIYLSMYIPRYLSVTGVVFCSDNIIGTCSYTYTDGRLQLYVSSDNIYFYNKTSDLFAVVSLKIDGFVPYDVTVTVKPDYIYVDGGNVLYNISEVYSTMTLRYKEMNALAKVPGYSNPLISHKYGADPYVLTHKDRIYIYLTSDAYEYDSHGKLINNTYDKINKITIISSADMVNWTDHGEIPVAGSAGIAKWAAHSWAPAVAYKKIDGKDRFFLYFANDASNIGVLTSDSPIGPWTDPLGKSIINRMVPGVENVTWCFDPAVLVDNDGTGYLYFGGGLPSNSQKDALHPRTGRVIRLGDDMISTDGEAVLIDAPALFEDSGIHKYNGKYYYTYCSNFSGVHPDSYPPHGEIAYMVSDNPMGPFVYKGSILKNPTQFFGVGGNNHHCVFEFNNQWYIAYHAQTLGKAVGKVKGYRSPHINKLEYFEDGNIKPVEADMNGISIQSTVNPYERVEAETIAWSAGISTEPGGENMCVTDIHDGDWLAVSNVDFGTNGASRFTVNAASAIGGEIEIIMNSPLGEVIGILGVGSTGGEAVWELKSCDVTKVTGIHNIFFVFKGDSDKNLFNLDYWVFTEQR